MKNEIIRKLCPRRIHQVLGGLIPTLLVLATATPSLRAGVLITAVESGDDGFGNPEPDGLEYSRRL